jgi:hypothetical protein
VSPTVFREKGYRFFFFSREETRVHVHVHAVDGEAKFWLEPTFDLARNAGLSKTQITEIRQIIEAHRDEIQTAWEQHFGR